MGALFRSITSLAVLLVMGISSECLILGGEAGGELYYEDCSDCGALDEEMIMND